jgi:UDP-N-acetyl-D-mannosaminuronic acid dehydrogenase
MEELVNNDRIVGGLTDEATNLAVKFYESFVSGKVIKTNARTAELCKLSENSFRDINIAFANELSIICDKENIDAWELINLANRHPRVNILQPSVGVGGHCIAVDPWFIVANNEVESKIIQTARQVNMSKTDWVVKKIYSILESKRLGDKKNITIGCLGVTFKPDVDDIRESPALRIVKELISSGNDVMVADPNITQEMPFKMHDLKTVIQNADILVFLVKHKEFVALRNSRYLNKKIVLDFCGSFKI